MNLRQQILAKFKDKEYRDAFVAENIYSRLPLKIRAMREARGLSQSGLGALAGVKQEWISKLEDPSYGRLTISTLLKIASAFDCGLSVDFVPFSQILNSATSLSAPSFKVPDFAHDEALSGEAVSSVSTLTGVKQECIPIGLHDQGIVRYYDAGRIAEYEAERTYTPYPEVTEVAVVDNRTAA
jgi:transcriptional regulator with XRE-family HTH domain